MVQNLNNRIVHSHRGCPTLAPENTLPSFKLVKEYNPNGYFETDIQPTSDGHVVVIHDDYLDRTTNGTGRVDEHTLDEIKQLDAGSWFDPKFAGTKTMTVDELIDMINEEGLNANIEMKTIIGPRAEELANIEIPKFAKALDRVKPGIKVMVSSFSDVLLMKLHEARPQTKLAWLIKTPNMKENWYQIMQACGCKTIHPSWRGLTKAQIQQWKKMGIEVNVWTVDKIDIANELWNWGADGVITNMTQRMFGQKKGAPEYGHFLKFWE